MYVQKKSGNSEGEGGSQLWNSDGIGGVTHFGISEGDPCRNSVYFKYTFYVLLRKKVHLKYTSFVLPEKKYK